MIKILLLIEGYRALAGDHNWPALVFFIFLLLFEIFRPTIRIYRIKDE